MLPNVLNRGRHLVAIALLGAALAAALALGGTTPADAQSGNCPGSLIESRNLNVGGKKVGELDVYYDAATGRNCARMNHAGDTWGKKLQTRAWIGICSRDQAGQRHVPLRPGHGRRRQGQLRLLRRAREDQGVGRRALHRGQRLPLDRRHAVRRRHQAVGRPLRRVMA